MLGDKWRWLEYLMIGSWVNLLLCTAWLSAEQGAPGLTSKTVLTRRSRRLLSPYMTVDTCRRVAFQCSKTFVEQPVLLAEAASSETYAVKIAKPAIRSRS
jgi:hypothetical protein